MKPYIFYLFIFFGLLPLFSIAQSRQCLTDEATREFLQSPEFPKLNKLLQFKPQWKLPKEPLHTLSTLPDTIAVIVHVVWSNSSQNIPDSLIYQQLDVLNKDFPRLNDDSVNTPAPFAAIAGRANLRFQLARRDQYGAVTNGIIRRQTSHGPFSSFVDLMQTAMGGDDAWGSDYLNIYCVDIDPSTGAAGLAFHGSNMCMIDYTYFGLNGFANEGRACTHEVGHCFSLNHIWGTESTSGPFDCANDDGIADTPPQYQPSSLCFSFPTYDTCTAGGDGIMYMNYMDYSWGVCKNMFSAGQVQAMQSHIATNYPNILNSSGLIPVPAFDAGMVNIIEPHGATCNMIFPIAVIRNWGADSLFNATVYYQVDNNPSSSFNWTGNLANYETDTISFPQINLLGGNHTFTVYTNQPNGNSDANLLNDTSVIAFTSGNYLSLPVVEGFENVFPPAGWSLSSPDTSFGFRLDPTVSNAGNNSMVFYSTANNSYTSKIEASFQTNFQNFNSIQLSFDYAHTYANCCGYLDTLDIFVSVDCGQNYTLVSRQYGNTIQTAPVVTVFSSLFVPNLNEWNNKIVDLSVYAGNPDITIRFRITNMWGLQFYIDNVNITATNVGIEDFLNHKNNLYPNPNNGKFFFDCGDSETNIRIFSLEGKLVYEKPSLKRKVEIDALLVKGIYYMKSFNESGIDTYKIVVE